MVTVDMRVDSGDLEIGVLGAFAAFDNQRRANQPDCLGERFEILLNLSRQRGLSAGQRFVQKDQRLFEREILPRAQDVFQNHVRRIKDVAGEIHPQRIAHLDLSLDDRHSLTVIDTPYRSSAMFFGIGWLPSSK